MAFHSETKHTGPTPISVTGHVSFLSSEQVKKNSSKSIYDEVQVDMTHIPTPVTHKKYYAWLLSDMNQSDPLSILLGVLPVQEGTSHLFYVGSMQPTNLLAITSRFLVTEEDATLTPVSPSPDTTTWCYYADFAQMLPTSSNLLSNTNKGSMSSIHEGSTQSTPFRFPIYPLYKKGA